MPKIKVTYTLDVDSLRALEELARQWGVSKSEALRRAIRREWGRLSQTSRQGVGALQADRPRKVGARRET